jgi:hypothetical protein
MDPKDVIKKIYETAYGRSVINADEHIETVEDLSSAWINQILEIPGVVNAILAAVPDDYEWSDETGSNPNKATLAYYYIWGQVFGKDEDKQD